METLQGDCRKTFSIGVTSAVKGLSILDEVAALYPSAAVTTPLTKGTPPLSIDQVVELGAGGEAGLESRR